MKPILLFLAITNSWFVASALIAADPQLAAEAQKVLKKHCGKCHADGEQGVFVLDVKKLIEDDYLAPGKSDESLIYSQIIDDVMPPDESDRIAITKNDLQIIDRWISEGADEFPSVVPRDPIRLQTIYRSALSHLRRTPAPARRYTRFFTLHNVYNRSEIPVEQLDLFRAGISKAINSLSWEREISLPVKVAPASGNGTGGQAPELHETLFAIDIRDFGWDRNDSWRKMVKRYPYAISWEFSDAELHQFDQAIQDLTESSVPIIRSDWFIANATRPPLYHQILEIPESAVDLEARLRVDIAANFLDPEPDRIARAGFTVSGVSQQNRMVERSSSGFGYYWKSYDFKPDTGRGNLTRFPLGPSSILGTDQRVFESFAFEHDGGEIIFSLPNGLQAYMLVDGHDNRIDSGPIEVVFDHRRTSGTPLIVNGLSCMACHKRGMITFQDTIRDGSAVFGSTEQHVKKLYPPMDTWDPMVQKDIDQFMAALKRCVSPWMTVDSSSESDTLVEPISKSVEIHASTNLDLAAVLTELDLDSAEQLFDLGDRTLKKLGLDSLRNGGVIKRQEWEAFDRQFGPSLMQQTASELGATPVRPL